MFKLIFSQLGQSGAIRGVKGDKAWVIIREEK
jgi:hypothetical protein